MTDRPTQRTLAGSRYLALRTLARRAGRPTAELLHLYALEGFLGRLARSPYRDALVLKGGLLLAAFDLRRPTRDVDLLALRFDNDVNTVQRLISEIAADAMDDGLSFVADANGAIAIRDDDLYPGVRVRLEALLATARLVIYVDVNVGDPVVPPPERTALPTLLGGPGIELLAYPRAMVVAEKLATAMQRGTANTRWRDFADLLLLLSTRTDADGAAEALWAVTSHRRVPLLALSDTLSGMAPASEGRWVAWRREQHLDARVPGRFGELLEALLPLADALIANAKRHGS